MGLINQQTPLRPAHIVYNLNIYIYLYIQSYRYSHIHSDLTASLNKHFFRLVKYVHLPKYIYNYHYPENIYNYILYIYIHIKVWVCLFKNGSCLQWPSWRGKWCISDVANFRCQMSQRNIYIKERKHRR